MNKVKIYFMLPLISFVLFSCNNEEDPKVVVPPRDYAVQYPIDLDSIESYLKTHSFEVVEIDGKTDVKIDTFIVGNTEGKVSIWDNTQYPLQSKMIMNDSRLSDLVSGRINDPVEYKMYYLILNEGGGASATRFDSTYVSYRGWRLDNTQFDVSNQPIWNTFPRISVGEVAFISGFRQFTSLLKAAVPPFLPNSDGQISYNNSGVGVVFLPSALGYYSTFSDNIPTYSPLVFTIRLHTVRERDHDQDGILSKFENGENVEDLHTIDTDGDNIPDFLDRDDDGDKVRTSLEIINPLTGKRFKYDEFDQIPTCPGGTLKKHLDPSCQ
jgi:hypothetical protein